MRSKEFAHDYRYFPEPDLLPLIVSDAWREEIGKTIPELPEARRNRFVAQYGLPEYDAEVLTATQELADYFEKAAVGSSDKKITANWVMGELLGALKAAGLEITASPVSPENLAGLVVLIHDGTVSGKMAKSVFEKMFAASQSAREALDHLGIRQITDEGEIRNVIRTVIAASPKQIEQYRSGKTTLFGYFVGQV